MQRDPEVSVTRRARRAQIVAAAVEVLAGDGYRALTFHRLAQDAGLSSTRLISYHFRGKDDLVAATLEHLFDTVGGFVAKRVTDHPDAASALAGYLRTAVALNDTHRAEMRALAEVVLHHQPADGAESYPAAREDAATGRVEAILREGQDAGLFRPFDPWVMAVTVQRSVDGLAFLLRTHPDLDLDAFADELVATFDRATRA